MPQAAKASSLPAWFKRKHGGGDESKKAKPPPTVLTCTWNVAAINNNPLEYWVSWDDGDDSYKKLMMGVESIMDTPGDSDLTLESVFPAAACKELFEVMRELKLDGVDEVATIWEEDLMKRRMVTDFLKDKDLRREFLSLLNGRESR